MILQAFGAAQSHVSLKIRHLNATAHLTNFYLSATNDIDSKEVTVTVNEGARDTDPDNIHIQNKPNRPSYVTNENKPSKRPRAKYIGVVVFFFCSRQLRGKRV